MEASKHLSVDKSKTQKLFLHVDKSKAHRCNLRHSQQWVYKQEIEIHPSLAPGGVGETRASHDYTMTDYFAAPVKFAAIGRPSRSRAYPAAMSGLREDNATVGLQHTPIPSAARKYVFDPTLAAFSPLLYGAQSPRSRCPYNHTPLVPTGCKSIMPHNTTRKLRLNAIRE
ncbi:unnamed protein product [Ectocarpus sp. 13 AM-2016]